VVSKRIRRLYPGAEAVKPPAEAGSACSSSKKLHPAGNNAQKEKQKTSPLGPVC
jgi:hypothetical protein